MLMPTKHTPKRAPKKSARVIIDRKVYDLLLKAWKLLDEAAEQGNCLQVSPSMIRDTDKMMREWSTVRTHLVTDAPPAVP